MAISETLAQAIINPRGPDIVGAFERGQEKALARKTRTLSGEALQAGGGAALTELQGINPEVALAIGESIQAQSGKDINDFVRDAIIGERMLLAGNIPGFISFADNRIRILERQGRNFKQTRDIRNLAATGQAARALEELQAFTGVLEKTKGIALGAGQRLVDPTTGQVLLEEKAAVKPGKVTTVNPNNVFDDASGIPSILQVDETGKPQVVNLTGLESRKALALKENNRKEQLARRKFLNEKQIEASTQSGLEFLRKIPNSEKGIKNIDRAIFELESGAETGFIDQFLPNVIAATINLDQIRKELGLDIVQRTTFGQLSKGELDLSLTAALPVGLEPKELIKFLEAKREILVLADQYIRDAAKFLSDGGRISDFIEQQEAEVRARNEAGDSGGFDDDFSERPQ